MKKTIYYILAIATLVMVGCTEDPTNDLLNGGDEQSNSEIIGETITFQLDSDDTRTSLNGSKIEWQADDCISVNGTSYKVTMVDGVPTLKVAVSSNGVYNAYYPGGCYDASGLTAFFRQTPIQFYTAGSFGRDALSMYATATISESTETPTLRFNSLVGVLMLTIKGTAEIESIYVEDRAGENVSGDFKIDTQNCILEQYKSRVCRKGVTLNCLNAQGEGVKLTEGGMVFYIVMPARTYSSGLKIRISDTSHRSMTIDSGTSRTIERGKILVTPAITYAPTTVYEEHFDLMVWGGDIMSGEKRGYTPTAANTAAPTSVTGFERTLYDAKYDIAGSNYMSTDYSNMTAVSHNMSESYLRSRGIFSAPWLFRVEERPGYIGVGAQQKGGRGRYRTAPFTNLSKPAQVAVEFKFCPMNNYTTTYSSDGSTLPNNLHIWFRNAGYISEAYIDGKKFELTSSNHGYTRNGKAATEVKGLNEYSELLLPPSAMTIPTSATAAKTWHTIKLIVNDVRDDSAMDLYVSTAVGSYLGYYVDDIVVTKIKDMPTETLKVLYWNIQNGMWADQGNGYKKFIAWVKALDPDVCVWCEARTIYNDKGTGSISDESLNKGTYLINKSKSLTWGTVAKGYGHNYWTYGAYQDNYPVVITAKSAITLKQRLGNDTTGKSSGRDANVSHGGFHAQLGGINYVGLHLYPHSYGYGVTGDANREASTAKNEGNDYRLKEMTWIIGKTKNNKDYSAQTNWIMCGDFNSKSRLDEWYYKVGSTTHTQYKVHNYILDNTNYCDVIQTIYNNKMAPSRIDFMYVSPDMMKRVVRAYMPNNEDDMTTKVKDTTSGYYRYSDHNAIIAEFDMSK